MSSRISAELAQLARLAREGSIDLGQVSLRVKADLLLSTPEPAADDIAAFTELAAAVIPTMDEAGAEILARKLAGWKHAPASVLEALRARGGAVLVALLRHGWPLPQPDLESIAMQANGPVALALAQRRDLPAAACMMLAGRGERDVDLALLANPASLPRAAFDLLLARARTDSEYAPRLLARRDIADADLAALFLHAAPERRASIIDGLAARDVLEPAERRPLPEPDVYAGWLLTAGEDREGFFALVAGHLGGGAALSRAMARDPSRDLAALALVAAGLRPEEATRLLIRLGDDAAHSVDRIFALVELMRSVGRGVALRLVMQVAGVSVQPVQRRSLHQPAMGPSGSPVRPGTAKPEGRTMLDQLRRNLGRREQG